MDPNQTSIKKYDLNNPVEGQQVFEATVGGSTEKYTLDPDTGNIFGMYDPNPSPRANINESNPFGVHAQILSAYNDFKKGTKSTYDYSLSAEQNGQVVNGVSKPVAPPPVTTNAGTFTPPEIGTISNPVTPPDTGSNIPAPNLPNPSGAMTSATNLNSISTTFTGQKQAVLDEATKRAKDYQTKIDAFDTQIADLTSLQNEGMSGISDATIQETVDKKAALELEKQRFDENYNANQSLVGELDALLTSGNSLIEEMKGTTGLSSIMNPRISKTMSDVQARAGVIQAVLSARNGQMSYAQQQLNTTLDAITSITNDQINYYKTLISFYDGQKKDAQSASLSLSKDQRGYLDTKLNLLTDELNNTQATTNIISKAMLDPDTATTYAMAGVSLNDTPEQIASKLGTYAYSQELKTTSNTMATNGYTSTPIAGVTPTVITDSKGNTKNWYKKAPNVELSPGATLVGPDGKVITTAPTAAQQNDSGYTQAEIDQIKANQEAAAKLGVTIPGVSNTGTTTGAKTTTAKVSVSGKLNYTADDVGAGQQLLEKSRGSDNYVDPNVYLQMYQKWVGAGGLLQDFLTKYPAKNYVNPANTWMPEFLMPGGKRATTTTGRTV